MAAASAWRHRLAQQLAPAYARVPAVYAVILGGSAARGWADRYSDIELGVFWKRAPTDAERRAIAHAAGGEQLRLDGYDPAHQVWLEDYRVAGVIIDVVHRTVETTEDLIADVLLQYDITDYKQTLLAALRDAIPLAGESVIAPWQAQVRVYPDGLLLAMLDAHLRFPPWWSVEAFAQRNDVVMVVQALSTVSQRLVAAVLAINKHYYYGMKWLPQQLAPLAVVPPAFGARLHRCFDGVLHHGVSEMATLVDETLMLAAQYAPGIDWTARQERFRSKRLPIDAPPDALR